MLEYQKVVFFDRRRAFGKATIWQAYKDYSLIPQIEKVVYGIFYVLYEYYTFWV